MSYHRDNTLLYSVLAIIALIVGAVWWDCSGCEKVCAANGDKNAWDARTGCYCDDGSGLYNPKDSRE